LEAIRASADEAVELASVLRAREEGHLAFQVGHRYPVLRVQYHQKLRGVLPAETVNCPSPRHPPPVTRGALTGKNLLRGRSPRSNPGLVRRAPRARPGA